MTLQELFNLVLIRAGQFLLGSDVELNVDRFKTLAEFCLEAYSKYKPRREPTQITITNYQYRFTDNIPIYISDVNPTFSVVSNPFLTELEMSKQPITIDWEYRPPILYTTFNGNAEVEAWYKWKLQYDGTNYIVPIDDELFVDLVTSEFLMGLARSRRAFTLQEIPISTDAEILASEGKDLKEDTLKRLQETSILL